MSDSDFKNPFPDPNAPIDPNTLNQLQMIAIKEDLKKLAEKLAKLENLVNRVNGLDNLVASIITLTKLQNARISDLEGKAAPLKTPEIPKRSFIASLLEIFRRR